MAAGMSGASLQFDPCNSASYLIVIHLDLGHVLLLIALTILAVFTYHYLSCVTNAANTAALLEAHNTAVIESIRNILGEELKRAFDQTLPDTDVVESQQLMCRTADMMWQEDRWEIGDSSLTDRTFVAHGSEGEVYSALFCGRRVAMKQVKDTKSTEIEYLSRLRHENIIQLIGVCTVGPKCAIVMEYCPRGTLRDELGKAKHIGPRMFYNWSIQIAAGMSYLHRKRIIHRDLKSTNQTFV